MKKKHYQAIVAILSSLFFSGICLAIFGFGLLFAFTGSTSATIEPTPRRKIDLARLPSPTPSEVPPTASPTPEPPTETPTTVVTETPTETATTAPTETPTTVPTETLVPTPSPPPLPTATPQPTETSTPAPPAYAFSIKETAQFPTNHLNFDVYVAVVDKRNKPLSNYHIVGTHSSGLRLESQPSANDWTVNSGAMHYKAGNIKYEAFNSPSGAWNLQLADSEGKLVGPPVEFPFDSDSPSWYFLIYERQ